MKSTTEPFRVVCKLLDGRINCAGRLLFLDSILYHGWFAKHAPKVLTGEQKEENAGYFGLPLRQLPNNRYAASCGFYRLLDERIEYWNKRPDWAGHGEHYDSDAYGGKVDIRSGQFRAYRMPQVILTAAEIEFFGYGTVEKVRELLSHIPAVGKKPAAGWGAVREWVVEPWPEDWSTWSDKYGLMRPIPVGEDIGHDMSGYRVADCAIRPPAWKHINQTTCYIPEVAHEL